MGPGPPRRVREVCGSVRALPEPVPEVAGRVRVLGEEACVVPGGSGGLPEVSGNIPDGSVDSPDASAGSISVVSGARKGETAPNRGSDAAPVPRARSLRFGGVATRGARSSRSASTAKLKCGRSCARALNASPPYGATSIPPQRGRPFSQTACFFSCGLRISSGTFLGRNPPQPVRCRAPEGGTGRRSSS